MPASPTPALRSSVANRVKRVVQTVFAGLANEDGSLLGLYDAATNPGGVQVRHAYATLEPNYPEVVVSVLFGDIPITPGDGWLDEDLDPVIGNASGGVGGIQGFMSEGSVITLGIRTQLEAMRDYLADEIVRAIGFRYWTNPATGVIYERYVIQALAEAGIELSMIGTMTVPRPKTTDPRSREQIWDVDIPLRCAITVYDVITPGAPLGPTTITSGAAGESGPTDSLTIQTTDTLINPAF